MPLPFPPKKVSPGFDDWMFKFWKTAGAGGGGGAGTGFTSTTTAGTQVKATNNSAGLSMAVPAYITVAAGVGISLAAGTRTASTAGAILFNTGNGITFGLDAVGGSVMTASHNAITTGRASTDAIGLNTALTANGVSMTANSSGLSMNFPAFLTTAQPVGAYLTTARASNDAIGLNTALTANGVSVTANSSGLSLNFPAFLTTAALSGNTTKYAGLGFTSTTTAGTDVKGTHSTNGLSMAFPAWLTTAALSGDTTKYAGLGFTSTTIAGTDVKGTHSTNGLSMAFPAWLTAAAGGGGIGIAAGTRTATTAGSLLFDTGNGITFGLNAVGGSIMTASHNAITTGRASTDAIGLNSGLTNVGFGGASVTANSSGLSINFPAFIGTGFTSTTTAGTGVVGTVSTNGVSMAFPAWLTAAAGGAGVTLSNWEPFPLMNNTTFSTAGLSSLYLQKLWPQAAVSFSVVERYGSFSFASSTNNQSANYSFLYGLYSRGAGASSTRMELMSSSQMDIRAAYSSNSSMAFSVVVGANTYATNSAGTGMFASISGAKHLYFPFVGSMAAGNEYWLGFNMLSATTVSSAILRIALLEMTVINNLSWGKIKSNTTLASATSYVGDFKQGVYATQTAAMPATIGDANISNQVSLGKMFVMFDNL